MKKLNIRDFVFTGFLSAIIILMTAVPQVGFITLTPLVAVTLLHIPVLVGVFLLPKRLSLILGLVFGVSSWIRSFAPTGPLDFAFQNPLVSVLPRVLFALAAAYVFDGLKWLNQKIKYGDLVTFILVVIITLFGLYYGAVAINQFTGWSLSWLVPVAFIIEVIFLGLYFAFINGKQKANVFLPSSFILGTVIHTLLVLIMLTLVSSELVQSFFPDKTLIGIILTVAATNGLIEAVFAALIGTPILVALNAYMSKNQ